MKKLIYLLFSLAISYCSVGQIGVTNSTKLPTKALDSLYAHKNNAVLTGTSYLKGDLKVDGKISITTGVNTSTGTAILINGIVTINTNMIKTNSLIWVQYHGITTVATSNLTVPIINDSVSFIIKAISSGSNVVNLTDTNTIKWWIIN